MKYYKKNQWRTLLSNGFQFYSKGLHSLTELWPCKINYNNLYNFVSDGPTKIEMLQLNPEEDRLMSVTCSAYGVYPEPIVNITYTGTEKYVSIIGFQINIVVILTYYLAAIYSKTLIINQ